MFCCLERCNHLVSGAQTPHAGENMRADIVMLVFRRRVIIPPHSSLKARRALFAFYRLHPPLTRRLCKAFLPNSGQDACPSTRALILLPCVMVFVTIFIAWQFAAGLALYRMTSLLLNMIEQYFITGWGSFLAGPNFGNITKSGDIKSHAHVQQARPHLKSSSAQRRALGKGASARQRGKTSRKNRA